MADFSDSTPEVFPNSEFDVGLLHAMVKTNIKIQIRCRDFIDIIPLLKLSSILVSLYKGCS